MSYFVYSLSCKFIKKNKKKTPSTKKTRNSFNI